jgi:hypothetical protein
MTAKSSITQKTTRSEQTGLPATTSKTGTILTMYSIFLIYLMIYCLVHEATLFINQIQNALFYQKPSSQVGEAVNPIIDPVEFFFFQKKKQKCCSASQMPPVDLAKP